MKNINSKYIFFYIHFFCIIISHTIADTSTELNLQLTTQRRYSNPRFDGLSNSGVAIPEAISSTLLNPSLVHFWHWKNETKYSAIFNYENDEYFKKNIINTGVSWYIDPKATIGAIYRHIKMDVDRYQNETVLNISGKLFDKSLDQGAVNIGINVRYEDVRWLYHDLDSTNTITNNITDTIQKDTIKYPPAITNRFIEQKRFFFDLGFFQDNIFDGMDFGLTFHNLLGRYWKSETPFIKNVIDTLLDSTMIDTTIKDSSFYSNEWMKNKGRNPKEYKRMTVGITYHFRLMDKMVLIIIPFDLEFLGLFDKKKDIKIALHTGIEGWLNEKICLRFGYSRAPQKIYGKINPLPIDYDNILSGGASVRFDHISFDVYMKKKQWGIGCVVAF